MKPYAVAEAKAEIGAIAERAIDSAQSSIEAAGERAVARIDAEAALFESAGETAALGALYDRAVVAFVEPVALTNRSDRGDHPVSLYWIGLRTGNGEIELRRSTNPIQVAPRKYHAVFFLVPAEG